MKGEKSCGVDDHIHWPLDAVGCENRVRPHFGDAIGDEVDVLSRHRGIKIVGNEHTLAAHGVHRHEFVMQDGILDDAFEKCGRTLLTASHQLGFQREAQRDRFGVPILHRPPQALEQWDASKGPACQPRCGPVVAGQHPRRRALKDVQRADLTGNLWNKLNGAGAGADHGHGLARQVDFMPPAGRMKCWPRKRFEARQRRGFR